MKYDILTISPIHIGTGNYMTPFECILLNKRFVAIDMNRVLADNPARAIELNQTIDKNPLEFSLSKFLNDSEKQNPVFYKYSAGLSHSVKLVLQEEHRNGSDCMDISECSKTAPDSRLYIPGSSLKGALRTALAYSILGRNPSLLRELKQRLTHMNWRKSDDAVNEVIFQGARRDPTYDVLKILQISDSTTLPAHEETLEIGAMKILSLTAPGKTEKPEGTMSAQLRALNLASAEQIPLKHQWGFQEIVKPKQRFRGDITIDGRLLNHPDAENLLGWKHTHQQEFSVKALLQAANQFARDICAWELAFFEQQVSGINVQSVLDFYRTLQLQIQQADENTCYLCIGQGAGWHKTTIGMLLETDNSFDFKAFRKQFQLAQERLDFDFPKSRKLLMRSDTEIHAVYGWVEVRIEMLS